MKYYKIEDNKFETLNEIPENGIEITKEEFLLDNNLPDITDFKNILISSINEVFEKKLQEKLGELIPKSEMASWSEQRTEADLLLKSKTIDNTNYPILNAIATNRNINIKVLAEKVIEKSNIYKQLSGELIGKRQNYIKIVEDALTKESLFNLEFKF